MPSVLGRLLANVRPTTKASLGKKRWGTEVGHDDSRAPQTTTTMPQTESSPLAFPQEIPFCASNSDRG